MKFELVDEDNFFQAVTVYTASWRESHKDICSQVFIKNRDYAGYLRDKLGSLYLILDQEPVGVFCLQGTLLQDLYIHPIWEEDMERPAFDSLLRRQEVFG